MLVATLRTPELWTPTSERQASLCPWYHVTGCQAFVIDLRGNPGGFLGGGIDTARLFLPAVEKITSVVGRTGIVEEYQTTDDGEDSCSEQLSEIGRAHV